MHIQTALFDLEAGLIKRKLNSQLLHAQLRTEAYQGKRGGEAALKQDHFGSTPLSRLKSVSH